MVFLEDEGFAFFLHHTRIDELLASQVAAGSDIVLHAFKASDRGF